MKLTVLLAHGRSIGVCLAVVGMLWLASCESQSGVKPLTKSAADSTSHNLVADDPPVKPSGPGGGP
ncbi:hypothetical protein LXM25_16155 [Dyadobacter sp. LJ53]|uniref:hypothetical protein n=1 Tax=Dyadobacter chenwenxiniae TaxID=2906456 RepID=UPI001F2217E1|nr:hypothetical protein [Dyadobacter chenwenxiniae]MCF0051602.1 hypothetical protein [Dyadobacter chenwenxiniae]